MQSDRELLENAAKAAGYDALAAMYGWDEIGGGIFLDRNDPPETWNPLRSDGDALRLAVKLNITVHPGFTYTPTGKLINCRDHANRLAATRRAIVRAAAEIGRSMK